MFAKTTENGASTKKVKIDPKELATLREDIARLQSRVEELEPLNRQLSEAKQSIERLTNTKFELSSKHAQEIQALKKQLDDKAREYSELEQQFQIQSTVAVTHEDVEIHSEELMQLRAQLSDHEELVGQAKLFDARVAELEVELETIRAKKDKTAENVADGELLGTLREELSEKMELIQSLGLTVAELEEKILRLAEQNRLQLDEASVRQKSLNSSEASLQQLQQEFSSASRVIETLKETAKSSGVAFEGLQRANAALTRDAQEAGNNIIRLEQQCATLENSTKAQIHAGFLTSMVLREQKATDAISHLQDELSADAEQNPTTNDTAIKSIVAILTNGLDAADPQAYFDAQKDGLKTHLNALRGIKSVMNTALNAILTVLAVGSVVGIPALYFTGTWQKNAEKNGSVFAFSMFGAEQKAKCDIYEATQALGVTLGA
ncbi:MAG: hypothetical protein WCR08_00325 [Gammaproteobacteria bacterium]